MFEINDPIFFSGTGVCRITGIQAVKFGTMEEQECYVLKPVADPSSCLYIPVMNDEVQSDIRPVLTQEAVSHLIHMMPQEESIWISNDRDRCKDYLAKIQSCDSRQLIKIIKTLYIEKNINSKTKRLNTSDAKIMSIAEKLLYEEFAFVLGIDPKEVVSYIRDRIPQSAQQAS